MNSRTPKVTRHANQKSKPADKDVIPNGGFTSTNADYATAMSVLSPPGQGIVKWPGGPSPPAKIVSHLVLPHYRPTVLFLRLRISEHDH